MQRRQREKLRGLVSFVLPLIAVPVFSVTVFIVYDTLRSIGNWDDATFQWIVFPEAIVVLPGMLIIVAAFAAILGMQMSLRCRTTVMAVMLSVGIVVGLCGALGWCGWQLLSPNGSGQVGVVAGAFSPFTLLTMLIVAAVIDARRRRIPNWLTLTLMICGIAQSFTAAHTVGPGAALLGIFGGFALMLGQFALGGLGGGDVKLLMGVGAWVGPLPLLAVFAAASVIGMVIVISQALWQGRLATLVRVMLSSLQRPR